MLINLRDQSLWWTMAMLKNSIKLMKTKNTDGRYTPAIDKEEALLRSFFDQALGRPEAVTEEVAA